VTDQPRRVRHLVKGLGPGGAERLIVNQISATAPDDEHQVAYLVAAKDQLVAELEAGGVTVHCLDNRSRLGWIWRLRKLLKSDPTDILHTHSPAVAAVARLVVLSLRPRDRPVLVGTEHNRWPRHHWLTRTANRLTIRFETATIAVSEDVASTIVGARSGQVRTIIHGIDLDVARGNADRSTTRQELGATSDDVLAVCVANLRREKALDELVEAAALALAQAPRLKYVIAGQGPLAADLNRWITERGLGDRFLALGYRPDVARILSAGDFFTLSSHHEGLPVALMEALALGLPIAATAAGGVPQAAGSAGLITPIGDVEALAASHVRLALDASERSRLATNANQQALRFSIARATAEIEAVYDAASADVAARDNKQS